MSNRIVYVVETLSRINGHWYVWSAHRRRADAWAEMRGARREWPDDKFRTVPYRNATP